MLMSKKTAWVSILLISFTAFFFAFKPFLNLNSRIFSLASWSKQETVPDSKSSQNSPARVGAFSDKTIEEQVLEQFPDIKQSGVEPEIIMHTSGLLNTDQELILHGINNSKTIEAQKDVESCGSTKIASRGSSIPKINCIWPVKGHVTSGFGPRGGEFHEGIDICAPIGTSICAVMDGKVLSSGGNAGGYGNLIIIQHPNGIKSYYGHCSKLLVSAGQYVSCGQIIAKVGMTGNATGSHCHFEIRVSDIPVNPIKYIH